MSAQIKDGGPAFPVVQTYHDYDQNNEKHYPNTFSEGGMSLRDYFAAKAMAFVDGSLRASEFSAQCYRIADAMIAAREVRA
jgi:hypothetical protein